MTSLIGHLAMLSQNNIISDATLLLLICGMFGAFSRQNFFIYLKAISGTEDTATRGHNV
jgi:hypothetical protein